jgi:hypothetical protein
MFPLSVIVITPPRANVSNFTLDDHIRAHAAIDADTHTTREMPILGVPFSYTARAQGYATNRMVLETGYCWRTCLVRQR